MKIAFIGNMDPASSGYNYARALTKHTYCEAKAFYRDITYAAPHDDGRLETDECLSWVSESAVVFGHAAGTRWELDTFKAVRPYITHWWIDGGEFRGNSTTRSAGLAGKRLIATNHDIADEYGAHWLPCCVAENVDAGEVVRERGTARVVIHMCSDPTVKNTTEFEDALRALRGRWAREVLRGKPHSVAMDIMRKCWAVFDHMQGYFGVATMEATAIGVPVMNGLNARGWEHMQAWGVKEMPPWHIVNTRQALQHQVEVGFDRWTDDERRAWHVKEFSNEIKAKRLVKWLEANC